MPEKRIEITHYDQLEVGGRYVGQSYGNGHDPFDGHPFRVLWVPFWGKESDESMVLCIVVEVEEYDGPRGRSCFTVQGAPIWWLNQRNQTDVYAQAVPLRWLGLDRFPRSNTTYRLVEE